jgi:hypothetical protein
VNDRSKMWLGALAVVVCALLGWLFHVQNSSVPVKEGLTPWAHQTMGILNEKSAQPGLVAFSEPWVVAKFKSDLPGHWGTFEKGRLQPHMNLKVRFDHFLTQRTDQSIDAVRRTLHAIALQDLSQEEANAVMAVWDVYVDLLIREEAAHNSVVEGDSTPERWLATHVQFLNQAQVRMGRAWSDAFFTEQLAQVENLAVRDEKK